jgi:hypothetical protein
VEAGLSFSLGKSVDWGYLRTTAKKIFVPKRQKMTRRWWKLNNLYSSPYIIRVIKLRRMR